MAKIKITIEHLPKDSETEIVLRCNEVDESLLQLIYALKTSSKKIIGLLDKQIYILQADDVYYFESVDNKVFIYGKDKVYESRLRLYEIEAEYGGGDFFRSSKSTVLNISMIDSVAPMFYGKFEALLQNGEKSEISRQYVPVLKQKLGL